MTVRVAVATAGKLDVELRYAVPGASWVPSYDARLRAADRAIELTYYGMVRNATGEDWNGIALTLSTARPGLGGGAPGLCPGWCPGWRKYRFFKHSFILCGYLNSFFKRSVALLKDCEAEQPLSAARIEQKSISILYLYFTPLIIVNFEPAR